MKAIGEIVDRKSATGHSMVRMIIDGKWDNGCFCLDNENEIPNGHPRFGLFEFCPEDQFCKWIDPNW